MAKVGGEKHLIPEGTLPAVYDTLLSQPIDQEILKKIDLLRQSSNAYLDRALGLKQPQFA